MRHIRTRRRYRFALSVLFIICATLFIESRMEALVPELKSFAETRVEAMMGGRIRLSIGNVDGGIFHPIVLNDVRIEQAKGSVLFQSLVINNIRTTYRIWDVFRKRGAAPELLEKGSSIYANFSMRRGDVRGFVALEGDPADTKLSGYIVVLRKQKINFSATVKGDVADLEIWPDRPDRGSMRIRGGIRDDGTVSADVKFYHLKLGSFDVVCDAAVQAIITKGQDGKGGAIEGSLATRNLVVNYKTFADLKATYRIADGILEIPELGLGETLKLSGSVMMKKPVALDLTLVANNVSLSWLMLTLGSKEATSILTGTMSGKFCFSGPVETMKVKSRFDVRGGTIGPLDFDHLTAGISGDVPFLKIEDSRITRKSGSFSLAGELDLRRIGKDNLFDDIRLVTDDGAINWDELGSVRTYDGQKLSMRKNLSEHIDFEFKKVFDDYKIDESMREGDEMKFEYKLQANDSLKMMLGQDNDFFGFEHKDRF